jgi:hypothetical protein
MNVLADTSEPAARAAYACFGPHLAFVFEERFVAAATSHPRQPAPYRVAQDGRLVFYANGQGTGRIVHLDAEGRVGGSSDLCPRRAGDGEIPAHPS